MRKRESFELEFPQEAEPVEPKKKRAALSRFSLYDFADSVIYALIAIAIVFTVFIRFFAVDGDSMIPTLHDGERVAVTACGYSPASGDIVVISPSATFSEPLIKRVIALEGDVVDINVTTGKVLVNSMELEELYVNGPTTKMYDLAFPLTVPEGYVFVLGDNREASLDSRSSLIGFVDERSIVGRVLIRANPLHWRIYD